MRVAVVGSGLAGLTTAHLLVREGVEVYLLEKSSTLGFHSQSVSINDNGNDDNDDKGSVRDVDEKDNVQRQRRSQRPKAKQRWVVDVPMRGFQGGYYPLLLSLYNHLSLPLISTSYTFSFSQPRTTTQTQERGQGQGQETYFVHSGASGLSIPSLPSSSFSSPKALFQGLSRLLGVALSYLLLVVLAFLTWHNLLPWTLSDPQLTLGQFTFLLSTFLTRPFAFGPQTPLGDIFTLFMSTIVLPLFSAVGTMTSTDVWNTSAREILEYIHLTLGTDHYHLGDGMSAADVARLLVKPLEEQGQGHLRLNAEIGAIEYDYRGVRIRLKHNRSKEDEEEEEEEEIIVDKVVLATQASVAQQLLKSLAESLKECGEEKERKRIALMMTGLANVNYRETIVVTHRDMSILPSRADTRDLNLFVPSSSKEDNPTLVSQSHTTHPHNGGNVIDNDPDTNNSRGEIPFFNPLTDGIYTMATQIISSPHLAASSAPVLQTTNPVVPINPDLVLSVSRMERALPLHTPDETISSLRPSYPNPNALVYLVGSYAYPGIPLLEGCVGSAKLVAEEILRYNTKTTRRWSDWVRGQDQGVGGVRWDVGKGGWLMRLWRWRRRSNRL